MAEEKVLLPEEISQLRELNQKYSDLIASVGELEIKLDLLEQKKADFLSEKKLLLSDYSKLKERETEITNKLLDKYGEGKIDLESGKIEII